MAEPNNSSCDSTAFLFHSFPATWKALQDVHTKTKRLRQTCKTDPDNLHALQYIALRYGIPPAVNHMQTYASAALRTYYAPPAHTAPYVLLGDWVPGPAHGIAESRSGHPSNPTHKLYSPFPDSYNLKSDIEKKN